MNTEIKFRAKRKLNGNWVYGSYIKNANEDWCAISETVIGDEKIKIVRVITKTVSQFTGLKSSNEGGLPIKEAYFGDIIRFYNTEGHEKQAELMWYELEHCIGFKRLEDGFVYTQRMFNDSGYFQPSKIKFEIIGNIYDNPELIK